MSLELVRSLSKQYSDSIRSLFLGVGISSLWNLCRKRTAGIQTRAISCRRVLCPYIAAACSCQVTYYHFQLEAWMGLYPNDWRHIQDTYASMAPKDLGSHGYMGLVTMYIPAPIQNQAYTTKGKALEWYREWNVSWNDPAAFFGSTSTVTTSKLKPCNSSESGMTDDPMMRRHVQMTGDLGGVVIKDETWQCILPPPPVWMRAYTGRSCSFI